MNHLHHFLLNIILSLITVRCVERLKRMRKSGEICSKINATLTHKKEKTKSQLHILNGDSLCSIHTRSKCCIGIYMSECGLLMDDRHLLDDMKG